MLTLIAESKTMSSCEYTIPEDVYLKNAPAFETEAAEIMEYLATLNLTELSQRISISPGLAAKATRMIYEFPNKSTGEIAFYAFIGEVFRGIDINSLDSEDIKFAEDHIRLISSLYGILRPQDIIKPYRLDFNADCSPGGGKLSNYWKSKLTIALVKNLKETGENEILDLLPAEAAKCLDWKIIKAFAKVQKADFKIIDDNGNLKTPHSGKLKELRGKMVRTILTAKINDFKTLLTIKTEDFAADNEMHRPGLPLFISLK